MKKRMILINCCFAIMVLTCGCRKISPKTATTEKTAITEKTEITEKTAITEVPAEIPSAEATADPITETEAEQAAAAETAADTEPAADIEATAETAGAQTYEEEMRQCPYCAYWFSTLLDDGISSPYERHILKERKEDPAGGQTEQDMVQCPDCGNWYESGNIFRNHICEGRSY